MLNGDDIYYPEDMEAIAASGDSAVLGVPVEDPSRFGMLRVEKSRLIAIDEKPQNSAAKLANSGFFKFDMGIFNRLRELEQSERGELELVDAVSALAERETVRVITSRRGFISVATGRDLLNAHRALWEEVLGQPGGIVIGDDAEITEDAMENIDYAVFGAGCEIGAVEAINNSVLFDGVTVGDGATVVDSVLGEAVKIAPGVSIAGAIVGDGETIDRDMAGESEK